jgi:hypothetical protein
MKTLKQEADEYFPLLDTTNDRKGVIEEENLQLLGHRKSFIAGANSKWVQAQIIKAKIDGLLLANDNGSGIMYRIQELEEQLNELENEK